MDKNVIIKLLKKLNPDYMTIHEILRIRNTFERSNTLRRSMSSYIKRRK